MTIERVIDHVDQAKDLLLTQYKNKPRMGGWLASLIRRVQELDDAAYYVMWKRLIDFAELAQLDVIGRLVGEERRGATDPVYRVFLRARIKTNRSEGTIADISEIVEALIPGIDFRCNDVHPLGIAIDLDESPADPVRVLLMLLDAKAGGVGLSLVVPTTDPDHWFCFNSVGDESDSRHAFGDANDLSETDGLFSDAVTVR